jgi:hypothetical protein
VIALRKERERGERERDETEEKRESKINYITNKQSHKVPKSYLQRNKFGPFRNNIFTPKIKIFAGSCVAYS